MPATNIINSGRLSCSTLTLGSNWCCYHKRTHENQTLKSGILMLFMTPIYENDNSVLEFYFLSFVCSRDLLLVQSHLAEVIHNATLIMLQISSSAPNWEESIYIHPFLEKEVWTRFILPC